MKFDIRYGNHPSDSARYDTRELRERYLIEGVFAPDDVLLTYSHQDRIIAGGVMPVSRAIELLPDKEMAAEYFLERREMGVINIGGGGTLTLDGKSYNMERYDGIYIGMGVKSIVFTSVDSANPAKFYLNSAPAHHAYETVFIPLAKANKVALGSVKTLNKRVINQYVHPAVCKSCQLVMGMTILDEGSAWNTMPCHTHERRMEVYLYFNLPAGGNVFHLMGAPQETRHIVVRNEQAVISPSWSIHSGVGTTNYTFIWGMCGENQVFDDMDFVADGDIL